MKVFKAGVVAVAIGLAVVGCAQTPKRSSLVVGESGCQSGRFDVYFVENQARLTDAAQLLLNTAAEKARQCRVAKVRVLGLADATGARLSHSPQALSSALAKLDAYSRQIPLHNATPQTANMFIVSPFAGAGGVTSLFTTHPPIQDRIARLQQMARTGSYNA